MNAGICNPWVYKTLILIPIGFPLTFFFKSAMGENLLYSRFCAGGERGSYIASFPGGGATKMEKLLYNNNGVL